MRMTSCALVLLAVVAFASRTGHAAPLNTWGEFIGHRVFAATPYVYAGPSFGLQPWLYGEYGFTKGFELAVALGATVAPRQSLDAVELLPRFFLDDQTGVAVRTTWSIAAMAWTVAPELHLVRTFGPFELTMNPFWAPVLGVQGLDAGTIGAIVAPEWFFSESCSVFVELTPIFDVGIEETKLFDRLSFDVLPGIGFTVADLHQFSVGVGIRVVPFDLSEIYGGMWYSVAFGGAEG